MAESAHLTEDIYKYIPPPIPLIPKNKYTDDVPLSHQPLMTTQISTANERTKDAIGPSSTYPFVVIPTLTLSSFFEPKSIVHKRDPKSKSTKQELLNLSSFFSLEKPAAAPQEIKPFYKPLENDKTLVFESRFECGNLWMSSKISENEYNLMMQNDINTKGHTQWFYFQVSNTSQTTVKFNIINFSKPGSLYSSGMKVSIFSILSGSGWFRGGENITYFPNGIKKGKKGKTYYTMSFTYTFTFANDIIYFAYALPYTYSDNMKLLQCLEDDEERRHFVKRRLLTHSIAGNRCDYLTITAPGTPEDLRQRKGVVISARVHPGETVGSWMMQGVLEFLAGNSSEAILLRENFIFKIIPMLNPDGVINGNYRCNLAGVDLNRQWKDPNKNLHPTIFAAKRLIKAFAKEREIVLICDLHGHSRRSNIFMYGCSDPDYPELTRRFPYLLSKISNYFSYKSCSFRMQRSKQSTLRISIFNETKVVNTFTLESTFCGCDFGPTAGNHLTSTDLKQMGKELCLTIMIDGGLKVIQGPEPLMELDSVIEELKNNKELLVEDPDQSSSGSDSDPSEDNLDEGELNKLLSSPSPKRRISSDSKQNKKKVIANRINFQIPLKKYTITDKTMRVLQKCINCGELKEPGHSCMKKSIFKNSMLQSNTFNSARTGYRDSRKTNLNSLSQSTNIFPVYLNPGGKKVRDKATQTTALISPKKTESNLTSMYFLTSSEASPIVSAGSPLRKSDVLENLVDLEKLKNIFKNDKNVLPSISGSKSLVSESLTKTF